MNGEHETTCHAGWFCRIVLEPRFYQGTSWIHDARNATAAQIKIPRMIQTKGMSIFMCSGSGTFIQILNYKITCIASKSIYKRDIAMHKFFNAEIIVARIGILQYLQFANIGFAFCRDAEYNCIMIMMEINHTSRLIP